MVKLEGARCLHAVHRNVQCAACVVACPSRALSLGAEGPVVDGARCDGCARCVPACTEGALEVAQPELEVRGAAERMVFAACERSDVKGPHPCLHSLDWPRLRAAHARGVRRWVLATAPCDACPRRPGDRDDTLDARLAALDAISRSRGQGAVHVEWRTPDAWHAQRRREKPEPARRALFRWLIPDAGTRPLRLGGGEAPAAAGVLATPAAAPAAGPLSRFALAIDDARCSGCLACAGVCPHQALTVERDSRDAPLALVVEADACTGCRLCEAACDDGALAVHHLAAQRAARLALTPIACPTCREVHHRPAASTVRCARRAPPPRVLVLEDP